MEQQRQIPPFTLEQPFAGMPSVSAAAQPSSGTPHGVMPGGAVMHIIARYALTRQTLPQQLNALDPETTCVTKSRQTCAKHSITVRARVLLSSRSGHMDTSPPHCDPAPDTVSHALSLMRKDSFASLCLTIAKYCDQPDHILALQDVLDLAWPKRALFFFWFGCWPQECAGVHTVHHSVAIHTQLPATASMVCKLHHGPCQQPIRAGGDCGGAARSDATAAGHCAA